MTNHLALLEFLENHPGVQPGRFASMAAIRAAIPGFFDRKKFAPMRVSKKVAGGCLFVTSQMVFRNGEYSRRATVRMICSKGLVWNIGPFAGWEHGKHAVDSASRMWTHYQQSLIDPEEADAARRQATGVPS
jgi:hypothetical protein